MQHPKHKVLILGATSFIGKVIYHELCQFMVTYGTYQRADETFEDNEAFIKLDSSLANTAALLMDLAPTIIISCLEGDHKAQYEAHEAIAYYVASHADCTLLHLSSSKVFDAVYQFPSYENDEQAAASNFGKFKISVEKLLLKTIPNQVSILRIPMILGPYSPALIHLREAIKNKANFEVFPNRIISITTVNKLTQQVHYIINKNKTGIFHLASEDVVHHEDLFTEICEKAHGKFPVFQRVFTRNDDTYQAILPKENKLPKNYRITVQEVIDDCIMNEEIASLKL